MNFIKAQQELLKALVNGESHLLIGDYDDEHVAFTLNSINLVIVPKNMFYIDLAKTERFRSDIFSRYAKLAREQKWDEHKFFPTGISKAYNSETAVEFSDVNGNLKYVSQKLLKVYEDKRATNTYYGGEKVFDPLFVEVPVFKTVGLIMPIRKKDTNE